MSDQNAIAMFNPDQFLATAVQGVLDTQRKPLPAVEFNGFIKEIKKPEVVKTKKGDSILMEIPIQIDCAQYEQELGYSSSVRSYKCWLDINAVGNLDMGTGKNIDLGKIREAVGQNGPEEWTVTNLVGAPIRVQIKHREHEGKIYDEISAVGPVG